MKNIYKTLLAALAVTGILIFGGQEAKAQNSISIYSALKRTYVVEVQYHFHHWTSGGEQIYWKKVLETENYNEAQEQYELSLIEMEMGELDSWGTTTVTTAIDVRIRTEYEPIYQSPFSRYSFKLRR